MTEIEKHLREAMRAIANQNYGIAQVSLTAALVLLRDMQSRPP